MKREIKFRGRNKNGRGFIYGNLIYDLDPKRVENVMRKAWIREPLGLLGNTIEVDPETVAQYTGLPNDIYEGDIIKSKDYDAVFVIIWNEKECCFSGIHIDNYKKLDDPFWKRSILANAGHVHPNWIKEYDFEVIGNIHDNPELLTKEEKEEE